MIASIAFILSIVANAGCWLAHLDEDSILRVVHDESSYMQDHIWTRYSESEPAYIGLWCYRGTSGNRHDITYIDFGSKLDAARALGITSLVLGFCIWLSCLIALFVRFDPKVFKVIGGLCILNCMFQGLVFLIFKSRVCAGENLGCSLGAGGICGVLAVVLWFLAGIFSCAAGKEKEDDAPVNEAPAEKVQDETANEGE
jgi:hypothetical protein